jgi:hypothetical protein
MAKKSRKARSRRGQVAQPVRVARPVQPLANEGRSKEVDFAQEYHYVVEDLKRIALIALILFVLLIVLAIIIG